MKRFNKQAAQGDVLITKIDAIPEGLEVQQAENGKHVIAHSETGHHHTMVAEHVEAHTMPDEIYDIFLDVKEATPLVHERSFDTHEPIMLDEGKYHVRRQREHTPEGFRRAAD